MTSYLKEQSKRKTVRWLISLLFLLSFSFAIMQETELEQRVFEIARDLRCPVCTSESVSDSSADIAVEMRVIIQEKLEAGESEREIKAFFQERYGDWILLEPPRRGIHLVVWLLPTIVAAIGAGVLIMLVRRWTKSSQETITVDAADLARVREALDKA